MITWSKPFIASLPTSSSTKFKKKSSIFDCDYYFSKYWSTWVIWKVAYKMLRFKNKDNEEAKCEPDWCSYKSFLQLHFEEVDGKPRKDLSLKMNSKLFILKSFPTSTSVWYINQRCLLIESLFFAKQNVAFASQINSKFKMGVCYH